MTRDSDSPSSLPEEAVTGRSPHADVDVGRRRAKAQKIVALLEPELPPGVLDLLEVGTGSGVIADYLAGLQPPRFRVESVDVVDVRVVTGGYGFTRVTGTTLPFPDRSFDVVVSNHVLEHVGERADQELHLFEIARVMKPRGIAYLATPNRWAVIEPHFKLPFLSWLPESWRSRYLRAFRKGGHYDCRPLGYWELNQMLSDAGLGFEHLEVEALRMVGETEGASVLTTPATRIPAFLLATIKPISPTLVCTLFQNVGPSQ